MTFLNYWFVPLTLLPINEIYAWSNNEKIHIIAHTINDLIKSNENQDEAIKAVTEYLNALDETIKDDVFEMLLKWYNDGSLKLQLERKKILLVGDSYLAGETLGSPDTANYGALLSNKGFDITALATNGGGFAINGSAGTYGAGYNFKTIVQHFVGLHTQDELDLYTDVMFLGGINDSYSSNSLDTLPTAIKTAVEYVNTIFRNAKCHIGYISQLRRASSNSHRVGLTKEYYKTANVGNGIYKCCYINNSEYMLKGYQYIGTDGIHPTALGQEMIANYLTSYILNGNISVHRAEDNLSFSLDTSNPNYATSGAIAGSVELHNNIIRMNIYNAPAFSFANTPNFTFNGSTYVCIGRMNNMIWGQSPTIDVLNGVFGACGGTVGGTISFEYDIPNPDGEGTIVAQRTTACPFRLCIYQDHLFLSPVLLENASTYSTARLLQINLIPFSLVLSSDDC